MKGIVITTDMEIEVRDFSGPLHETIGKAVDGPIEIVKPMGLEAPFCMLVNEEFLVRDNPPDLNPIGSILYGTFIHGSPILGTIVIMKTGWTCDGPDIVGLSDKDIQTLTDCFREISKSLKSSELFKKGELPL